MDGIKFGDVREENFQIEEIGLRYIGHFNACELVLYARSFAFTIPVDRVREFAELFRDINWEDGYMLHKLQGRYMRALVYNGRVVGLKHITKSLVFWSDPSWK